MSSSLLYLFGLAVVAFGQPFVDVLSLSSADADTYRQQLVSMVNSNPNSTWSAVYPPVQRFHGKPYSVLASLAGVLGGDPSENAAALPVRKLADFTTAFGTQDIPASFDAQTAWPQCPIIAEIRDQSACGSCYAVSAASAATDRFCIHHNGTISERLSEVDLMSCCFKCKGSNGGCYGGTPSHCWDYMSQQGIASGGKYLDNSMCLAYPFPPCDHHIFGTYGACSATTYNSPTCFWACDSNSSSKVSYDKDQASHLFATSYKVDANVEAIQRDILAHGPSSASMFLVPSFEVYRSGVYTTTDQQYIGAHAVKIMGWGIDSGLHYWVIANSWNAEWGEAGRFRIERGKNVLGIESGVVGGSVVGFPSAPESIVV
ncbi:unnamed protein product [Prorocentrum cordatum]|uniref:Peptidase C1A papain C-terminal domain-containing protein n=1 Tax=Prorocentrum cordatum TaxID=2364126 RepID=A0ABN9S7P7_9DINO|nr:unnamed protein product [Polarella glacialis]